MKAKRKRGVRIPAAVILEIATDLDEHISTMRPNAIRAHLGMLRACIDDILDAYEGQGAIDEDE